MARWRRIAWSVGLGIATTVGVAWSARFGWLGGVGRAVRTEARAPDAPNYSPQKTGLIEVVRLEWRGGTEWSIWTGYRSVALRDHVPTATTPQELAPRWMLEAALASADWRDAATGIETEHAELGWPFRSLGWSADPGAPRTLRRIRGAVVIGQPGASYTGLSGLSAIVLPWRPVWWGLLGDMAIFASAWWVAISVPLVCRGWWRRRRGRCAECGYALKGLAPDTPCPECGKAVASVNTSTA